MIAASNVELALRRLQQIDEACDLGQAREWLIEAETNLGEELELTCTGVPDSTLADGTVVGYKHNGETCPVHEWLDPADQPEAEALRAKRNGWAT